MITDYPFRIKINCIATRKPESEADTSLFPNPTRVRVPNQQRIEKLEYGMYVGSSTAGEVSRQKMRFGIRTDDIYDHFTGVFFVVAKRLVQ